MKDEKEFLAEVEPMRFFNMDAKIECPNCETRMLLDGSDAPQELYLRDTFRASDTYFCPTCGFAAIITQVYVPHHKEVTYYLDDMKE